MPKEPKRVLDFGRVFFPRHNDRAIPDQILFQPLGNHVANVRKLVHCWKRDDFSRFDLDKSLRRVSQAAGLHDIGKPQRFGVNIKVQANGKIEFGYSFRGHRFLASDPDQPWVESLAKGHHDFSVHDICRDTYILKALINKLEDRDLRRDEAKKYKDILESDPLAYAHELYILEMCDQIEAEIACRFYEDKEQAESRAFMDFTITEPDDKTDKGTFFIDPWIFEKADEIELTLASWSMPFPDELRQSLAKARKDDDPALTKKLQDAVENWWNKLPTSLKSEKHKVIIKRLPQDGDCKLESQQVYQAVGRFTSNPMQDELARELDREKNPSPAILLKAPTGSGKTEAILFPALANNYRLFLVLPTRSLLDDQHKRIHGYLEEFSKLDQNRDREISLVIDTGAEMDRWLYINGVAKKPKVRPRRHLYKGNIILTTLDKFLYRYFSFGDKHKSFIFPHRIHRENTLICFDEAHSYDDISFTNFHSLVRSLYEAGRSLVLMTATLPDFSEGGDQNNDPFDYLKVIDYVDDANCVEKLRQFQKQTLNQPYLDKRSFKWLRGNEENTQDVAHFQNQVAQLVLEEWQAKPDRRILAVVETVRDAAAIYQQLKQQFGTNEDASGRFLFLYHGRIADQLRPDIYEEIKQRDNDKKPYILVTTSAIEVGCDLNAEVLISQICPPENLIQRAGRCNRRGDVLDAKIIVVGDRIPDFATSLDDAGWQDYQNTLQNLEEFDTQAIADCISHKQHIDDYRVVEIFSMLHDYVYGADLTCKPAHEKGLIPTRSWKPSVTLQFQGKPQDSREEVKHSISVPIDRLCGKDQYAYVCVNERRYDKETTCWNDNHPLGWGSAYSKDIIVHIANDLCDSILDATLPEDAPLPEYSYNPDLGFVELPGVFIKLKTNGAEERLLYKYKDRTQQKKSVIISYVKNLLED
jgi:CRISPR-associated endonuclease/helicase Cas3